MAGSTNKKLALQGLKRTTLHKVTENTDAAYKADTPLKLVGAQSLTKEVQRETNDIYADDTVYDTISDFNGETLTLTLAELPAEIESLLSGATYDETNNHIIYKTTDVAPEYAFAYMATNRSGGVRCFRHFVSKLTQVNVSHETRGASGDIAPYELVFQSTARKYDGAFREQQDFDTPEDGTKWLETVTAMPASEG